MPAEGPVRDRDAPDFELIETLRWEPGRGFVRLERHLARLSASAAELGFACDQRGTRSELLASVSGCRDILRIRLTLSPDGRIGITATPYMPVRSKTSWRLRLAQVRLNSSDTMLGHKTTRRDIYVQARAEFSADEADEVLLMNERGEICEGTITNVFVDPGDGVLVTPPLSCGLLPGVLRGELLENRRAREAVLTSDDLDGARALLVGNSLRGLVRGNIAAPESR